MRHIVLGAAIALGFAPMTRAVLAGVAALSVPYALAAPSINFGIGPGGFFFGLGL